jgi:ABC-type transporter Mla subunit MlaD
MRRLVALLALAAVAAAVVGIVSSSSSSRSSTARFDVIFDDARGLVGGQLVKIAGARAGEIDNVVLTPDFKARIEATVDRRFMPFHADATCTIRPEGLIAENYVQCDPGTAGSPVLQGSDGHPPTVPVADTTEPVSLLDLFNTFNLPTRQRMAVIINELGIATAGRGEDLNQILLRANPTLELARQAISILVTQRAQLRTLIDASNTVAAQGAAGRTNLQRFLDQAASLSTVTAAHSGALSEAIARLPGMLSATRPALNQLKTVATDGTPLLQELTNAAPSLNRVATDLGPFAAAAKPGLARLSVALRTAIPAIRQSTPLISTIRSYAHRSAPSTALAAKLFENLQQHGFSEEFLSIFYYVGVALSRFDSTSHLLPLFVIAPNSGACGQYATKPVAGCSAHYGAQTNYQPARATTAGPRGAGRRGRGPGSANAPATSAPGDSTATTTPGPTPTSPIPPAPTNVIQALTSFLLK